MHVYVQWCVVFIVYCDTGGEGMGREQTDNGKECIRRRFTAVED